MLRRIKHIKMIDVVSYQIYHPTTHPIFISCEYLQITYRSSINKYIIYYQTRKITFNSVHFTLHFLSLNMDLFSIQTFLLPLILLFFTLYIFLKPKHKTTAATKNGFKIYPIVGTLPEFLLNRHRFLDWTTEILSRTPTNTAVFHRPGKIHGIITANPLNVEHILKTNFENYPKGPRFIELLEDFLGRGIFNSDGYLWKVL